MVCKRVNACARVINPLSTPVIIAITPNPEPPEVTKSPEVFLSLDNPLVG